MNKNMSKQIRYPIYYRHLTQMEIFFIHLLIIIKCPVCGHLSKMINIKSDLLIREYCNCSNCDSQNRQRQIAHVLREAMGVSSLAEISKKSNKHIYNTEANGVLHNTLSKTKNYVCSEYFGPDYKSGQTVNGILHEDLQSLSFDDNSFDVVISADVFEHIPDPYKAHKEIFRSLKKGGRHIFTVPFYQDKFLDEKRVIIDDNNDIIILKEALYHLDPLDAKGVLVYNIFSLEMLVRLAEIGFVTNMYKLFVPSAGIWGNNAIVFESIKY